MKPINYFLMSIAFIVAFVFLLAAIVVGFLFQSTKTGFEVGQGMFIEMEEKIKKIMQ